jgi:hypothetical protein
MPDHVGQCVEPFLERVFEAVMHGAECFRGDFGGGQIRRAFETDRE